MRAFHPRPLFPRPLLWLAAIVAAPALVPAMPAAAQLSAPLDSAVLEHLEWRSVGPANFSGRVTDIEGIGSPSKTFYVAAASGGIWKTNNNGTTFRPIFDVERVAAMGDLAIAPSDTLQIWAGTGEEDSRNSISPGGGIYKSVDGGETWELKGLEATEVIGRIVVHPTNPDVVYVAALGHIWGHNPERGLYRTTDGGDTWELVKFISDAAGFVDVAMDPRDPDVLFAASWERVRGPWFLESGGPGSALWKTTDGGDTWTDVVGNGFPTATKGRIGLAIAPSNADVMYAMVEAEEEEDGSGGNGLYRSGDGGRTWEKTSDENTRPFYYSQVRVDVADPDRVYWSSTPVKYSNDGGRTSGNATVGLHVDHHAMWLDPNDPEHLVVGNDGGIGITWDKGGTYDFVNTFPLGQFYDVSYNMDVPYRICGGLQDNGTWCGPSRRAGGGIDNHMWATINGGDGFVTAQHPEMHHIAFAESQGGNMARIDMRTGDRTGLQKPSWRDRYLEYEDSIIVIWDDSTAAPPADAQQRIEDFRRLQQADSAAKEFRWNWNTPFFLSPHDPSVFYAGANRVLKSTSLGDDLEVISPDLSTQDSLKIAVSTQTTGGITPDVTGAETHATITALAESPLVRGRLFAGTDDGNVWTSPDDGGEWIELTARFDDMVPDSTYVTRIEPSSHVDDRFYVTFDNHRRNDFTPYVFVTDDGGETFRSIADGLPTDGPGFVHVVREDPTNPDLLFVGTDLGAWVSTDRGDHWQRFMNGLPTVPVHDLRIHPRDRELIAGTHGRSIWIVDIAPLQQLAEARMAEGPVLFEPAAGLQFGDAFVGGESPGHKYFEGDSRPYGATLQYWLSDDVESRQVDLTITAPDGTPFRTIQGAGRAGLHEVRWNFQGEAPDAVAELSPAERRDSLRTFNTVKAVADSLVEHEGVEREVMDRIMETVASGDRQRMFGFFGGGGGGGRGGDNLRPGETPVVASDAGAQGGPAAGGAQSGGAQSAMRQLFGALRQRGMGFNVFNRQGGPEAPLAEPGTYTVSMTVGDVTRSVPLEVTRHRHFEVTDEATRGFFYGVDSWDDLLERIEKGEVETLRGG
jgi:photosystem II stability/assembly factor-like uncharacterized protein